MKVHLFSIPAFDGEESLVALNAFLATHAIQDLDRRFVDAGLSSHLFLTPCTSIEVMGAGQKGSERVVRGGSWNNNARNVRAAYRNTNDPDNRNNNLGFRLARAHLPAGWPVADPAGIQPVIPGVARASRGPGGSENRKGTGARVGRRSRGERPPVPGLSARGRRSRP